MSPLRSSTPACRAGPDRVLESVEHEVGGHPGGGPPAHDATAEHVEDERDVDHARPRRHVREVGDPQLVRAGSEELPIDQVGRPLARTRRGPWCGSSCAAAHRPSPARRRAARSCTGPRHVPCDRRCSHILRAPKRANSFCRARSASITSTISGVPQRPLRRPPGHVRRSRWRGRS